MKAAIDTLQPPSRGWIITILLTVLLLIGADLAIAWLFEPVPLPDPSHHFPE